MTLDWSVAVVVASQAVIPALFAWQLFKSERWCRRYEKMLERQHRKYVETIATSMGVPVIESETTDQLLARMTRLQQWRLHGLTPPDDEPMDPS